MTEKFREMLPAAEGAGRRETPGVLIREAEERDVPEIAVLEKRCFSDAWSETSVLGTLKSPLGYVLIAERTDGEGFDLPCGYLIAQVFDGEGELLRIAAAPEARRRGTGRALLERMLEDRPDVSVWRLDVRTKNAAAIALYEKYGFRIVTENPDAYKDPRDNGYLMIRTAETR